MVELLANCYGLVVAHSLSSVISGRIIIQVLYSPTKTVSIHEASTGCKVRSTGLQEEGNNLVDERIERMLEKAVALGYKERREPKNCFINLRASLLYLIMILVAQDCIYRLEMHSPCASEQDSCPSINKHECVLY